MLAVDDVGRRADAFVVAGLAGQRQAGQASALALARLAELVVRIGLGPQRAALPDAVAQRLEQRRGTLRAAQRRGVVVLAELRLAQAEQRQRLQPALACAAGRGQRVLGGRRGGGPLALAQATPPPAGTAPAPAAPGCRPARCMACASASACARVAQCQAAFGAAVEQIELLRRGSAPAWPAPRRPAPRPARAGRPRRCRRWPTGPRRCRLRAAAAPRRLRCVCWRRLRHGGEAVRSGPGGRVSQRVYRRSGQNHPQ